MTIVAEPPAAEPRAADLTKRTRPGRSAPVPPAPSEPAPVATPGPGVGRLVATWLAITVVGVIVVLVAFGPATEQRDQRRLLEGYRTAIVEASNQAFGLPGIETPTFAPAPGDAVAVLDIGGIGLRRVVVEGSDPSQTRMGPGHVPGTGGPGQPGNSVIVGRRSLFGGAFASLDDVVVGERIVVSTVQGQTVYEVVHVGTHTIVDPEDATDDDVPDAVDDVDAAAEAAGGVGAATVDEAPADVVLPPGEVTVDEVFGPSNDDRLTLVTSASALPWASEEAVVVVARLDGTPFQPTPQAGRVPGHDGRRGEPGVMAPLLLGLAGYLAAVAVTVWLHRTVSRRSAFLLSSPLLLALTVVLAEQIATALPAWA